MSSIPSYGIPDPTATAQAVISQLEANANDLASVQAALQQGIGTAAGDSFSELAQLQKTLRSTISRAANYTQKQLQAPQQAVSQALAAQQAMIAGSMPARESLYSMPGPLQTPAGYPAPGVLPQAPLVPRKRRSAVPVLPSRWGVRFLAHRAPGPAVGCRRRRRDSHRGPLHSRPRLHPRQPVLRDPPRPGRLRHPGARVLCDGPAAGVGRQDVPARPACRGPDLPRAVQSTALRAVRRCRAARNHGAAAHARLSRAGSRPPDSVVSSGACDGPSAGGRDRLLLLPRPVHPGRLPRVAG
jgi:hypothetical protein